MTDDVAHAQRVRLGQRLLALPEANILVFAFLLNFPWEMLQGPFFQGLAGMNHWEAVLGCTRHTGGDALIALFSFWAVALLWRERGWIRRPRLAQVCAFTAFGVVATIVLEWHATVLADRWTYAEHMPVLPILGTGLLPLMQWILLPPLLAWLVSRQLAGFERKS